jgi:hypothetical protein
LEYLFLKERGSSITDSPTQHGKERGVLSREGEMVVETKMEENAGNSGPYGIGRQSSFQLPAPQVALETNSRTTFIASS